MAVSTENHEAPFRILIVGGGIAGLAAAFALRRENRSILVLEQAQQNQEIGATISLQPNASKFVEKEWGLGPELERKGSMIDKAFRVCPAGGIEHKRIDLTSKSEYGGNRMLYHRQDLHETLKAAATSSDGKGSPAAIRIGCRVLSCDRSAGFVVLENGSILKGFDLIIGADGIKSKLRECVLGEESNPVPTGHSVYRMMIKTSDVEDDEEIRGFLDPREAITTMVMGHNTRLIMGPARNGDIYSIVAMVPDNEGAAAGSTNTSWTTEGSMEKLLESFKHFPGWCKRLFSHSPELGLWQLRDLDPLPTWTRDRLIIIGDAAHAMLPTQGQGASQCIEDVEALSTFLSDIAGKPTMTEIKSRLKLIDETRRPRASQIQLLSREAAKPATQKENSKITISPDQYMDYCCTYNGALAWRRQQDSTINAVDELAISYQSITVTVP